MKIRIATNSDRNAILSLYLQAFPESERDIISKLAVDLLADETTDPIISLVAELDGAVVGHIAFSPVVILADKNLLAYILAPLAVLPKYQKQGVGSKLFESGSAALLKREANILFVYGDPAYYGRFGFNTELAEKLLPRHRLEYPFGWQALTLAPFSGEITPGTIECVASLDDPALW